MTIVLPFAKKIYIKTKASKAEKKSHGREKLPTIVLFSNLSTWLSNSKHNETPKITIPGKDQSVNIGTTNFKGLIIETAKGKNASNKHFINGVHIPHYACRLHM